MYVIFKIFIGKFASHDNYSITVGHTPISTWLLQRHTLLSFSIFYLIGETLYHIIILLSMFKSMRDYKSFIYEFFFSEMPLPFLYIGLLLFFLLIYKISLHILAHCQMACYSCNLGLSPLLFLTRKNCFMLMWLMLSVF